MNKKSVIAALLLTTSSAAVHAQARPPQKEKECMASAGYTYSTLKEDCVRLFEQPVHLSPLHNEKTYTAEATVIFSSDGKKAEVFMPENDCSVILLKSAGKSTWLSGKLSLTQTGKTYLIRNGKTAVYQSKL